MKKLLLLCLISLGGLSQAIPAHPDIEGNGIVFDGKSTVIEEFEANQMAYSEWRSSCYESSNIKLVRKAVAAFDREHVDHDRFKISRYLALKTCEAHIREKWEGYLSGDLYRMRIKIFLEPIN